jgi:rubrerythrin
MSLINREALLRKQRSYYDYNGEKVGVVRVSDIVEAPEIKPEPERRNGIWQIEFVLPNVPKLWIWTCSECGYRNHNEYAPRNNFYCPNCGAYMGGEQ